ncbi:response regulator [Chryseolinea lacunae]|uniref:Response regulator n=1 Tax=Chryseolinea lacunae TaxID=2801331 RepID=A0ABS1KLY5_9BACT|nr:response regulator [Chryseolinea lacunae]MBL0740469.1 response regulator [Chryseolinea lacunae]
MTAHRNILLTDDDLDDRELFVEALASIDKSITCHLAENGKEALRLLQQKNIDVEAIFLDINMPVMDGWEFLNKLKNDHHYRDIPVIIYSTSSVEQDKNKALQLGAWTFITKPDSFTTLKEILRDVMQRL